MARFARVVLAGLPYHITHRGNRRDDVFFTPEDRDVYRAWLKEYAVQYGLDIWAYGLMTTHVHLLGVPQRETALAEAVGRAHMRYARWANRQQRWWGHLWANRFYSTPLDEEHLWAAVKYIERNPVRAGLVARAEDYPWSSARAHALGIDDPLLAPDRPFPGPVTTAGWSAYLAEPDDEELLRAIRRNTNTGWPTGSPEFVANLEARLGRTLTRQKAGRKPKQEREEGNR